MTSPWIRTTPPGGPRHWPRRSLLSVAGCGGKGTEPDDAVVVPAPDANLPTAGTSAPAASSGATARGRRGPGRLAVAPRRPPVKAEGWGTLKGQVIFEGDPPKPKELVAKGKAAKDPDRLRQGRADPVRTAGRRRGHQGRQERPRLHPQADGRERRGEVARPVGARSSSTRRTASSSRTSWPS